MFASALILILLVQTVKSPAHVPWQATDDRFVRDLHDKRIDDVLTLYAADAVFVNPDGEQIRGPKLRKLYETVTTTLDSDLHLKPEMYEQMGRSGEESGSYTETLRHRDTGKVDEVHGTYKFDVIHEKDGQWLFTRMEWH